MPDQVPSQALPPKTVGSWLSDLVRENIGLIAGTVFLSLITLSVLSLTSDVASFHAIVSSLAWPLLAVAMIFMMAEGILTATRLAYFSGRHTHGTPALRANAWYALSLVSLPARLGEVAGIFILERYLGQSRVEASMSIVVQRVYDAACLAAIFTLALLLVATDPDLKLLIWVGLGVFTLTALALILLPRLLSFGVGVVHRTLSSKRGWRTKMRSMLFRARTWHRHRIVPRGNLRPTLISAARWCANIIGFSLTIAAVRPDLGIEQFVVIASASTFLALIPLQFVGGVGIGDVGVAGLLVLFGDAWETAVATSVVIRIAIILAPVLFWIFVMSLTRDRQISDLQASVHNTNPR